MDFTLPTWLNDFGWILRTLLPGSILAAWCLWGVNWHKAWPVLAAGGWAPLVLIGVMAAFVWSHVWPTDVIVLGFLPVPNGVWQLGSVSLLIGVALCCGWLQARSGWAPPEISFEPPAHTAAHGHDHHGDHDHAPAAATTNGHPTH
jgi:hypothetical protein